jgi:type VI secretion system protein ImpK
MRFTSKDPSPAPRPAAAPSRRGQLALALQEVLTATVRLRANRQVANDADSFRNHIKQLLSGAQREARRLGYSSDDVALVLYAVVAFLDESVLNSSQPMFASWPSRPLQEEIFGGHMGGEIFFQHLRQLLSRQDSEDLADVLEVFHLCLLLGFQGRYSSADRGELRGLSNAAGEKIRRIRGSFGELSPSWELPDGETVPRARDRWLPWLTVAAVAAFVGVWLLFGWFRMTLDSRAAEFQTLSHAAGAAPS